MSTKKVQNSTNTLHLSLGSNIGERLLFIQEAIALIDSKVGKITKKASIYETPAWGFDGHDFLNTCIEIETQFATKECLKLFQEIEIYLGRKAKTSKNYESRVIDIDIIYSTEGIFNYSFITIPHPLLHQRKFVLLPLNDIIPHYKHPLLHKNTKQLIEICDDQSNISVFKEKKAF